MRVLVVEDDPDMASVLHRGLGEEGWDVDIAGTGQAGLQQALTGEPGHVLSRQQLLDHVWDPAFAPASNVVDVYVGYLRAKVDRPFGRQSLQTVRGLGYRLVPELVAR